MRGEVSMVMEHIIAAAAPWVLAATRLKHGHILPGRAVVLSLILGAAPWRCDAVQVIVATPTVQATAFTIAAGQPTFPNVQIPGLTVASGNSFTTNAQENSVGLSATITPQSLHQTNMANIQWLVDSNPSGGGDSGTPATPAAGSSTTLTISGAPAAAGGRGYRLSYRIRPTVQIQGGTAIDTTTITQDVTDRARQEYIDMNKNRLPGRAEFTSAGQSAQGHFTFAELNSGDFPAAIVVDALYNGLEEIRSIASPVAGLIVNGGYRNPRHNANILPAPGAPESQHIYGTAADLQLRDFNNDGVTDQADWTFLANAACTAGPGFIESFAQDNSHVHVDWGPTRTGGYTCP
ncbi:MAG: hypothetical protein HY925_15330 [Elusimicrobia bacterium]|nr:hypothetical protein [Elusimicrobiota bacterium]